jgi:hypothetical protein
MATHDMQMVRSAPFRNIELDHGRIVSDTGDRAAVPVPDPLLPLRASQAH